MTREGHLGVAAQQRRSVITTELTLGLDDGLLWQPTRRGSVHARTQSAAERGYAARRRLARDKAVADRERAVGLCGITLGRVRRQPTRPGEFDGDTTTRKGREGNNCPATSAEPAPASTTC